MRDPDRIDMVLGVLGAYWKRVPDCRLGQLIVNVVGKDPFFVEDDTLIQLLHQFFEKRVRKVPGRKKR